MHRFDAQDATRLEDPWRREMLPPLPTLERLGFRDDDTMLDFGCGVGYFSFPAAVFVGPRRKVFALDVSEAMLDEMDRRVQRLGTTNVVPLLSDGSDWKVPDASVTFVLCSSVLHEVEGKTAFLAEARRVLAPGGRLAVVEFMTDYTGRGPAATLRLSPAATAALLSAAGFVPGETVPISEAYYGLVGVLPEAPPAPADA